MLVVAKVRQPDGHELQVRSNWLQFLATMYVLLFVCTQSTDSVSMRCDFDVAGCGLTLLAAQSYIYMYIYMYIAVSLVNLHSRAR